MRVLVCGSRDWGDYGRIRRAMEQLPPGTVIIAGGASGADTMAARVARELKFRLEIYMAEWQRDGRAAGAIRNRRMLEEGRPDLVLAFYDPKKSKGTRNMVSIASAAKVKVKEFFK